jgi:hypothetical protein
VGVDGAGAKEEPLGDLGVGQASSHQPEHLKLARAQATDRRGGVRVGVSGSTNIVGDAPGFGDGLLQGKISSRGPGGGETLLPERLLGGCDRPLVLGAKGWRRGEADPRLDRLRGGEEADCALCVPKR